MSLSLRGSPTAAKNQICGTRPAAYESVRRGCDEIICKIATGMVSKVRYLVGWNTRWAQDNMQSSFNVDTLRPMWTLHFEPANISASVCSVQHVLDIN